MGCSKKSNPWTSAAFNLYWWPSKTSDILNPILFDTNHFYSNNDIEVLFLTISEERKNIAKLFNANKLSLNIGETKYSLFHKSSKRDDIPLRLLLLSIKETMIKRKSLIKCLGVIFNENFTLGAHIKKKSQPR